MAVEEHEIKVVAPAFLQHNILYVRELIEHIELCPVYTAEGTRHLLLQGNRLVFPCDHAVGEGTLSSIGHHPVELVVLAAEADQFRKILGQFGIAVLKFVRRMDTSGEYVAGYFLRRLRGEFIIEKAGFHAVAADRAENKVEVVVETVGWHR